MGNDKNKCEVWPLQNVGIGLTLCSASWVFSKHDSSLWKSILRTKSQARSTHHLLNLHSLLTAEQSLLTAGARTAYSSVALRKETKFCLAILDRFWGFTIKIGLLRCTQWAASSAGMSSTDFINTASTLWVEKLRMTQDVSQSTADILKLEKG